MQKSNDAVVSWYLNWSVLAMSLAFIFSTGSGFGAIYDFDAISWLLLLAAGVTTLSSQTLKFKALKLETASLLQKL